MQKHRLSEKLSGKKKISEATDYVEDEDSASRARAGPTPGPVSYGLAGPGAAPPAADIAGPSKRTNQLPSIAKLREAAETFQGLPSIYKRSKPGSQEDVALRQVLVPDWKAIQQRKETPKRKSLDVSSKQEAPIKQLPQKVAKVVKQKGTHSGRTYTSKYRGVHQTFPTQRWEAQFRRNGKPTSLGCFDYEHEAARAYDKMMIWCEIHQSSSVKGGITNFDLSEYDDVIPMLQQMEQDELVLKLRRDGRAQAAHGSMANKAANLRQKEVHETSVGTTQLCEEVVESRYNASHASP